MILESNFAEEEEHPLMKPTKENIRRALHWLVEDCAAGDSLLFYFSGHGSQQRNFTGDEIDGNDETLCPMDFLTQGVIVDDEINETIVRPLPYGVKLHAIFDACHSGTMLDLPFLCRMNRSVHCTSKSFRHLLYIIWNRNYIMLASQNVSGSKPLTICLYMCGLVGMT